MTPETENSPPTTSPSSSTSVESLSTLVGRMAGILANPRFPASDRAALKRHASGLPPPLAFFRLWLRHLEVDLPSESQSPAWALLAWGLAMAGRGAHRPERPLGRALAESGYSEARLERLLAADADSLEPLFESMVRFLAAKGEVFDWADAAFLLLVRESDKRQSTHRRIAAAYYRHLPRTDKE